MISAVWTGAVFDPRVWPLSARWHLLAAQSQIENHVKCRKTMAFLWKNGTLLYKMPSNLKGKNFVSKFPGYCPQNTMAFFSSKLDGIKK